jgi:hypothetical protein
MLETLNRALHSKSAAMLVSLESNLGRMMRTWLLLAGIAAALRIAVSPIPSGIEPGTFAPYFLLILAPVASMVLALRWFTRGERLPQATVRLARIGAWRLVGLGQAARHPLYGAGGLMVSLLVGMLLNVPLRAAEYLAAMPALSGPVPAWLSTLRLMMTIDVVLLTSLYIIAFVAALRRVPSFPRLLAAIWLLDLGMQIATARMVGEMPDLPANVAGALYFLLEGNVVKTLISIALWLPYLLLSKRVNVTYRHRVPA